VHTPATEGGGETPPADVIAYELHGNCYLNITWHCTLRCRFCPKFHNVWTVQGYDLRLHREPAVDEIIAAVGDPARYRQIVFCGLGEPTLRLDELLEVATQLKTRGASIRVNTDGLANLVHGEDVTPRLEGLVDSLSISLNAHNEALYNRHCRPLKTGAWQALQDFAAAALPHVPDITLTAIDGLPGVDITACRLIATRLGVKFRRRVLDEVG
jgi:TatD DNase family protein